MERSTSRRHETEGPERRTRVGSGSGFSGIRTWKTEAAPSQQLYAWGKGSNDLSESERTLLSGKGHLTCSMALDVPG